MEILSVTNFANHFSNLVQIKVIFFLEMPPHSTATAYSKISIFVNFLHLANAKVGSRTLLVKIEFRVILSTLSIKLDNFSSIFSRK